MRKTPWAITLGVLALASVALLGEPATITTTTVAEEKPVTNNGFRRTDQADKNGKDLDATTLASCAVGDVNASTFAGG